MAFPPVPAYSRELTEGVVDRHLAHREWMIIELPRLMVGRSPLPEGNVPIDGAIIWAEPRDQWVLDLVARNIPVVNCGMEWRNTKGVASVHFDYADLHSAVVRHIMELGLVRVSVVGHRLDQRPATLRVLEAFAEAAREAGLSSQVWELGGKDSPSVLPHRLLEPEFESRLAAFLSSLPKPGAIYCAGDHIAFIVCEVAARCGLRVPEDLAVIGQGNNLQARFSNPPLTTVIGAARAVGRAAADCLATWLETGCPPTTDIFIPGATLITRESTTGKSGSAVLESVRRLISSQAKRGITLGELAAMAGLSVKTLVRQYRDAYGIEPVDDLHRHRVQEAKRLLVQNDLPIAGVATACGFTSQAAFANYFQRHEGSCPSEWRQAHAREEQKDGA